MKETTKLGIIGALAGLANGFFGAGGGLFLVPLFISWAKLPERVSFATSVAVILPLSLCSATIYFFRGGLDFAAALPYVAGGLAGGLVSGLIFKKVPLPLLRRGFALLLLYGGIKGVLGL